MATYHFQAKVIGRSAGRSVVAAAAYRAAAALHDERLGRTQNYLAKPGVVHSEILLPEGAPERWRDRELLWNEVEQVERRRDAVLAREIEIALPRELPQAEAIALVRDFVREQFVARSMVADLNVHWGVASDGEAQPHAHVLLSMRAVGEDGFGLKQRDWNDKALLRDWRERWAVLANERLAEAGHDARIDHRSHAEHGLGLEPQNKIGPAGARRALRKEDAERAAEHRAIARRNGERLLAEPVLALEALTQQQSTFTRRDLARLVHRQSDGAAQFTAVMAAIEACPELVRLGRDGRGQERLTTRAMLATERRLEVMAAALSTRQTHAVPLARRQAAMASAALGAEQVLAFGHVTRARDLAVVVGYAGTGKSTMLGVARAAWEVEGYRVRGAALSGIAAEGLEGGSGIASRTLASLELAWSKGHDLLARNDVLVVDEAGLIGSRQMERLLARVREAGAKLVLVGDPEQLQAIEAGAAFRLIAERVGVAEITTVRRQQEKWQQEATRELATGRTAEALDRYEAAGAVYGHATLEEAKTALLAQWDTERQAQPEDSRIMLAHTRADVRDLNERARALREVAGETYWGRTVPTEQGERHFSIGDAVLFGRNDRGLGVKNGTRGRVEWISGIHGDHVLEIAVPEAGGGSRSVRVRLSEYGHLDHGYAATVHKTQGVTVDRAHVLATAGMDRHMAYVALTRHRDGVALHWSVDELGSREGLTRTLGRERLKDTSLDYGDSQDAVAAAGPEDAAATTQAFAERRGLHPLVPVSRIVLHAGQVAARQAVSLATLARRQVERRTLRDGLQPLLEMLREQAQLVDRLAARVARPPAPARPPEATPTAPVSRGPGALSQALQALARHELRSLRPAVPPVALVPQDDAAMREELTLALIVASTPGREQEGHRLLQRRGDMPWRVMRHQEQQRMRRELSPVLPPTGEGAASVERAQAATRLLRTEAMLRQEHAMRGSADGAMLEQALAQARERTVVHALSAQAQAALDRLEAAAATVGWPQLCDGQRRTKQFGMVGVLRVQLTAERTPVLQAWQAIAAQPRILAELERHEAVLRHRWDDDFLLRSAAAWRQRSVPRALQEPASRLAAEAVLIGYARDAAAAEQTWRTTPVVTAEPEAWVARAWASYERRPRTAGRPSRDASPGPSPG